jgi:hypothetical protein
VRSGPGYCPPKLHFRVRRRQDPPDPNQGSDDVSHAVHASLLALPDIVEEGRPDEVRVVVTTVEQPTGRIRRVDDITWFLAEEQVEQRGLQVVLGEGSLGGAGGNTVAKELACPLSHQNNRSKMPSMKNSKM